MKRRTNEEYVSLLAEDGKFCSLQPYNGSTKQILHKCLSCEYEWLVRPQQLLRPNSGCPKCTSWRNPIEKVLEVLCKANIELLSEYNGSLISIKVKHKSCGYEWRTKYSYIQQGSGCPECNSGYGYKIANKLPDRATLYVFDIITFDSEHFIKVGITSQPINKRINSLSSQIGDNLVRIKLIYSLNGSGKDILNLERLIHNDTTIKKYKSKHIFDGRTELKYFEEKDKIIEVLERNKNDYSICP